MSDLLGAARVLGDNVAARIGDLSATLFAISEYSKSVDARLTSRTEQVEQ